MRGASFPGLVMDNVQDHFINTANVAGIEETKTIAVLLTAKERRDQFIASDNPSGALLQSGIRFIEKNHGILLVGGLKST